MANLLEEQPAVQTFLESKNPSHEQIVMAYIARDDIFGHNNSDETFNNAMIKLGLHPDYYENEIDNRYRKVILDHVNYFLKDKNSFYIPNPSDKSFETLNNFNKSCNVDVFFALSHGVHRGKLKDSSRDDREAFINQLIKKCNNVRFDI